MNTSPDNAPLAIGGVGGSGTRLVAEIVQAMGWDLGHDLNGAHDNLWFTILFQRPDWFAAFPDPARINAAIALYHSARSTGLQGGAAALDLITALADRLEQPGTIPTGAGRDNAMRLAQSAAPRGEGQPWGWKEPNTHIFLPWLFAALPGLRYVHVLRDGRDMALSPNQNQLRNWGPWMIGEAATDGRDPAVRSLDYWLAANRRAVDLGQAHPGRFHLLNYDRLCAEPGPELAALGRFLERPVTPEIAGMIAPRSIGRHMGAQADKFSPEQLDGVARLMSLSAGL